MKAIIKTTKREVDVILTIDLEELKELTEGLGNIFKSTCEKAGMSEKSVKLASDLYFSLKGAIDRFV